MCIYIYIFFFAIPYITLVSLIYYLYIFRILLYMEERKKEKTKNHGLYRSAQAPSVIS